MFEKFVDDAVKNEILSSMESEHNKIKEQFEIKDKKLILNSEKKHIDERTL